MKKELEKKTVMDKVNWLLTHNKNYTKEQMHTLQDLAEQLEQPKPTSPIGSVEKRQEQLDNFEVYRIYYPDEYEHPNDIDLVSSQSIVEYVNDLIPSGGISDETLDLFYEKHQHGIQTSEDAVELLEADGYNVCLTTVKTHLA